MRRLSLCLAFLLLALGLTGPTLAQDYEWVYNLQVGPYSLEVPDGSSNVYLGGNFYGTVDFNPGSGTANLTSAGSSDAFLAKYTASGGYQWARRIGGSQFVFIDAIDVDSAGNVFATGHFSGTVDFDPGTGTANLTASGIIDGFLVKLNSSGTYQWARRIGGTGGTYPKGIELDSSGNLLVVGAYNSTTDFDPGPGTANLAASSTDVFFAKYNSSGNYVWAQRIDGSGQLLEPGLAVTGSNVVVVGTFSGTVNVIGATLSGSASQNVFVAEYNSSGTRQWSKVITGGSTTSGGGIGHPVAVDGSGNVYVGGHFTGSVTFAGQTVTSAGNSDVLLAKYNTSGTEQWVKRMGGSQDDLGYAVTTDGSGNVYLAGSYYGTGDWDPGPGTRTLPFAGYSDIFFGKYTSAGNLVWAHGLGSSGSGPITGDDQLFNITVDGSNNVYINSLLGGSVDFDLGSGTANASGRGFFAKYSQGGGSTGCVTPPANLRAWYPLDSASGSTVEDIAGSANGVRTGPVATTGKVAGAYDFDGVDDYVYVNDNSALDFGSGDFSIDAWIKTTDSDAMIVSKRQLTSGNYVGYLFMVYSGRLLLQIGDTTNSWANYTSTSIPLVNDGQWHLVAITVDRSSTTGGRFYVDGNLVYTFNPTNRSGNTSNSARLEIGRTTGGGNYFDGAIDEVELFNRALSASEIQSLWNAGANGKCKTTASAPLTVNLLCLSTIAGDYHSCSAATSGGSGGNSYSWSYFGDGIMSPSGSNADVTIFNCTGGRNTISVTVTDNSGAMASGFRNLSCDTSCSGFDCPQPQ